MLAVRNVSKYYGAHAAVQGLNMSIAAGQVVGLLGLNGAGKTTTLRILSGSLVPTSGSVTVGGLDMATQPEEVRGRIGFLPETPPLYPEMRVRDYLAFVARIKGVGGSLDVALREALAATDLQDVGRERIGTLSHGFQRRIGIAQAIVHRPQMILLDEPTSGLDPVQIVHMRRLIRALRGRYTVIISSHILGEIHEMCDFIFVLQRGRIAAEGTEAALASAVTANTRVQLEVRGGRAALQAALAACGGVVGHTVERDADGVLEATVELAGERREALAAALVQGGLGILALGRVRLELESIFLKLTGGGPADADAEPPGRPGDRP